MQLNRKIPSFFDKKLISKNNFYFFGRFIELSLTHYGGGKMCSIIIQSFIFYLNTITTSLKKYLIF